MEQPVTIESKCHTCPTRARSEQRPSTLPSRIWRWHTGRCPGWKAYTKGLESKGVPVPRI